MARNPTGTVPVLELDDDQLIDTIGIYFHFGTPGLGPTLQAYKSPAWAARGEWALRNLDRFIQGLHYFNGVLASSPYVAGANFSLADITVFAALMHACRRRRGGDSRRLPCPRRMASQSGRAPQREEPQRPSDGAASMMIPQHLPGWRLALLAGTFALACATLPASAAAAANAATAAVTAQTAPTRYIDAAGTRLAYRRFGKPGGVPLLFLQHFTGTLDNWDPQVVNGLAREREVILFDNAGVASSRGEVPPR